MNIDYRYTELEYYEQEQLKSLYNDTIAYEIWNKILRYREIKRIEIFDDYYYTYTNKIRDNINKIVNYHHIIRSNVIDSYKREVGLHDLGMSLDKKVFNYINNENYILAILVLISIDDMRYLEVINMLIEYYDLSFIKSYIIEMKVTKNVDITKTLSKNVENICLHFINKMVLLENSGVILKESRYRKIKYIYPMLCDKAINFYLEHSNVREFYSIQDYMKYNLVSYETARIGLQDLESKGLYLKVKVGKKYFYMIER